MMVKEEAFAAETPRQAKEPIGVRRVTRMDGIEAPAHELDTQRQKGCTYKAPRKLRDIAQQPLRLKGQAIAVDVNVLKAFARLPKTLCLRADY
jgi:hypothetical protein